VDFRPVVILGCRDASFASGHLRRFRHVDFDVCFTMKKHIGFDEIIAL